MNFFKVVSRKTKRLKDLSSKVLRKAKRAIRTANAPVVPVATKDNVYGYDFKVSSFLPDIGEYSSIDKSKKIKIRIVCSTGTHWSSYETLCQAFEQDERYDVLILLTDSYFTLTPGTIDKYGHHCIKENEYDAKEDKPDILIVTFSTDAARLTNQIGSFDLIVAATSDLILNSPVDSIAEYFPEFLQFRPDFYLMDSLLYHTNEKIGCGWNVYEAGNCKYDMIYNAYSAYSKGEISYPKEWKKLKGKKVFLCANDHGIYNGKIVQTCTFDIYAKPIFDYAKKHPEEGFIIRLHPTFFLEMSKHRFWSRHDIEALRLYCEMSPNIVFDENRTYDAAYSIADAIVVDAFCGMIASALPLGKPICALFRGDMRVRHMHQELINVYYQAKNPKELYNFFEMINRGEDPKKEKRLSMIDKCVMHFDGKNGERMKEFIEKKYLEKINCEAL